MNPPRPPIQQALRQTLWPAVVAAVLAAAAWLLFSHLGHYALWHDEAVVALHATEPPGGLGRVNPRISIPSAPILPSLMTRWSMQLFGPTAWAARLPFALTGLATVAFLLFWLGRQNVSPRYRAIFIIGLLGNVSFWLYFRNCAAAAPTLFASVIGAYCYLHYRGQKSLACPCLLSPRPVTFVTPSAAYARGMAGVGASQSLENTAFFNAPPLPGPSHWRTGPGDKLAISLALGWLACQLILGASGGVGLLAFNGTVALDYLVFVRKPRRLTRRQFAWATAAAALGAALWLVSWTLWEHHPWPPSESWALRQRLGFLWQLLRDANASEFAPGLLIAISPLLYLLTRRPALGRGAMAIGTFVILTAFCAPMRTAELPGTEVRYLPALIPAALALAALVVDVLCRQKALLAIPLALLVFTTNFFNGGPLQTRNRSRGGKLLNQLIWTPGAPPPGFRSSLGLYVKELLNPPPGPYRQAIAWISANVPAGQTLWVLPEFRVYPLLFHAPHPAYTRPLPWPPAEPPQWAAYDQPQSLPGYILIMGKEFGPFMSLWRHWKQVDIEYQLIGYIPFYGRDLYRPELIWHAFATVDNFDPATEGIYMLQKMPTKK